MKGSNFSMKMRKGVSDLLTLLTISKQRSKAEIISDLIRREAELSINESFAKMGYTDLFTKKGEVKNGTTD